MDGMKRLIVLSMMVVMAQGYAALAQEPIDVPRLADAIRKAEGNPNYGILKKIKGKNYRKACIQTIHHAIRDWDGKGDFIVFLGSRYCPVGASNDPRGLNGNWINNVRFFYEKH